MKTPALFKLLAAGGVTLALPGIAEAHANGGLPHSWSAGLAHPFLGADHVLAMVAVGFWAAQIGARARWLVPAAFVGAMACGAAAGANGVTLPLTEPFIFTSVIALGLLVATAARMSLGAAMGLTAALAVFHGLAHGIEGPVGASATGYIAALLVSTALLHGVGYLAGSLGGRFSALLPRVLGALCVTGGIALLFG